MAHILVVDDEPEICSVIQLIIEETTEHQVATATTALQALEIAQSQCPDLLITDIKMPGKDGLWLIDQIRELASNIPVVVMSGFTSATPIEIESRSPEAFLRKPDELSGILAVIEKLIS